MPENTKQKKHIRICSAPKEYPISLGWLKEQIRLKKIKAFKPSPQVVLLRRADLEALLESQPV